jgi:tetratricopeptide (TPR) repeat protein
MVRGQGPGVLRALLAALFGAMALCAGAAAQSQADAEPADYRALVDEAVLEFSERNFDESRSLFARAHELYPNARTLRGLGFAAYELRRYAECIERLEAALRSTVKPLEGQLRSDTEQLLARARNFVARVFVELKPASARLSVDGNEVELSPGVPLVLQVGEHTLEVRARGFQRERRSIHVNGGEDQRLGFLLLSDEAMLHSAAPAPGQRRWYKSPWLWGTLGVLAAGAVATTLILTQGGSTKHEEPNGGSASAVLVGPTQ